MQHYDSAEGDLPRLSVKVLGVYSGMLLSLLATLNTNFTRTFYDCNSMRSCPLYPKDTLRCFENGAAQLWQHVTFTTPEATCSPSHQRKSHNIRADGSNQL